MPRARSFYPEAAQQLDDVIARLNFIGGEREEIRKFWRCAKVAFHLINQMTHNAFIEEQDSQAECSRERNPLFHLTFFYPPRCRDSRAGTNVLIALFKPHAAAVGLSI